MEIVIIVAIILFIMKLLWKRYFIAPIREVEGGYKEDIILPHTEAVELYYADISSCSMKVRMCLAEAGIKFKSHLIKLPSIGSFETKTPAYLHINPAGTVPVLVHNGHPVHESSEQIRYIAINLLSTDGTKIFLIDPKEKLLNEYWVDQTSVYAHEIMQDPNVAFIRRPGNCLPAITMPIFAAVGETFSWKTVFTGLLIGGLTKKQILSTAFSIFGVYTFKFLPMLASMVRQSKKALLGHLLELEEHLNTTGSRFICGNDVTLADIGWSPILERMELAEWWQHIDSTLYPRVTQYWCELKSRHSYKEATKHIDIDENFMKMITTKLKKWKEQYDWFKKIYE